MREGVPESKDRLLFIDTNIWLDLYRTGDTTKEWLAHVAKVSDHLITTYQVEMEFKANRQSVILGELRRLDADTSFQRLGIFSDDPDAKALLEIGEKAKQYRKQLKAKLESVLTDPHTNDYFYREASALFRQDTGLCLLRDDDEKRSIREKALRRMSHGCPPRKSDSSIGDAFNWEWAILCAFAHKADLVIVTRDSDYFVTYGNKAFVNDHLKHEFADRVGREVTVYNRLSQAMKLFNVTVTAAEEKAEEDVIERARSERDQALSEVNRLGLNPWPVKLLRPGPESVATYMADKMALDAILERQGRGKGT